MKRQYLTAALLLLTAGPASAVEFKPGGLIFAHAEYLTSNHLKDGTTTQDYSAFEVSRIYLFADAKYDEKVSAYLRLEANLTSRDSKANRVYVKNAELRYKFNDAAKLSAGLVSVPWRGYEDELWQNRFVSKCLDDLEGISNSADRGIRLSGNVPYLAYDAMVMNGEGIGADSTAGNENTGFNGGGRLKDMLVKLAVAPFEKGGVWVKGLKINLQAHKGERNETTRRNRLYAGLSYDSGPVDVVATYYNADNGSTAGASRGEGFSVYTIVSPFEKYWGFARFDRYDPSIHAGGDAHNRYIYGLGYVLTKGVRISVDHQYLEQERRGPSMQDESLVSVHTEVKF